MVRPGVLQVTSLLELCWGVLARKVETSRAGCPLERGRGEFTGGTKLSQAQGPTKLNRGAPLGEGRGPGAGWGHAGRLLGESGGRRVVAARVGCWVSLVVVAVVRLGSAAWLLGLCWGASVGGCLEVQTTEGRWFLSTGPTQVVLGQCANLASIAQTATHVDINHSTRGWWWVHGVGRSHAALDHAALVSAARVERQRPSTITAMQ